MSMETKGKKRKPGDSIVQPAKKVKVAAAPKSAEKPTPLKSALKKSKVETVVAAAEPKKETKKTKAAKPAKKAETDEEETVSPVIPDTQFEDYEEDAGELTTDQTAALLAGFSSDEDSDSGDQEDGIAISRLPAAPTQGEVQKAIKKASKKSGDSTDAESKPGVIYISRLPHGFYEKQMRAYFAQFGTITHLRLARSKKSGKSKHYAFIEFAAASVADIVAKTMDKYLLFGHVLQAKRVPDEQVKEGIWKGPKGVRAGKVRPRNRIEGSKLRKGTDKDGWTKRITREEKRRAAKAEKLKEIGYEFEMPGLKSVEGIVATDKMIEEAPAAAAIEEPTQDETVVATIKSGSEGNVIVEKTAKRKTTVAGEKIATEKIATKKRKTKA